MRSLRIQVSGIVQGVGFRPFVYRIANDYGISGRVSNNTQGVDILASGDGDSLFLFLKALKDEAPAAALVERVNVTSADEIATGPFEIAPSDAEGSKQVLISPDLATCDDCVRELFDAADRRHRYPFINCTNCGPRFTIIRDTPYDRPLTSMSPFEMCAECAAEYADPSDRRFHAQPNACPVCGPRAWLVDRKGARIQGEAASEAARLLSEGGIVAIKGLGGFHLACDATDDEAVARLRERKRRYGKPLAVMVSDVGEARAICQVSEEEERLLASPRRPIVLLEELEGSALSREVAGGLDRQGVFLPYTPLHHLVLAGAGRPLVMTSGNISNEPIAIENDEAMKRLGDIADHFLLHDRDILVRYDDSVSRVFRGAEYPVRRARGYAPYPIRITPPADVQVLALGAELKNTFCVLRGEQAFMGQHIGDMESEGEVEHFEEALAAVLRLFSLEPEVVAHDLHPDYLTTQMAPEFGLPMVGVQHHHAHIVSCLADNAASGEVIGVAWDGTGYGTDGTVWGGEFLVCDETSFRRAAHLYRYPMPGADACIYRLYRMVYGVMSELFEDEETAMERLRARFDIDDAEAASLVFQVKNKVNTPITSSAGRLFDVAAALAGLRGEASYDGQAACELEAVARDTREYYNFILDRSAEPWVVDTRPVFREMLIDIDSGKAPAEVAGKFHATMALAIIETCEAIADATGLGRVALSGGVFQNEMLATWAVDGLTSSGLAVMVHGRVPCNDGGVSLGQAVVAARLS
ncbi:MAG TPA: carbamoyltransferase HypF [Candidatus Anoxymicrobiaceae bacterium]